MAGVKGARTSFVWNGGQLLLSADAGMEFGLQEVAIDIARSCKSLCHVDTGTLQRSYRTAPRGYLGGDDDEMRAADGEDLLDESIAVSAMGRWGASIEVGSWISYACVQEERNPAVSTAVSMESGAPATGTFVEALAAEGIIVTPL